MLPSRFLAHLAVSFVLALRANAETHTITFVNSCGAGSPQLMQDGQDLLHGKMSYTSQGSYSGIAYLQNGTTQCGANGENCVLLETTLINPTVPGGGSSTDLSLIAPHKFNQLTSFAYYDGCDGEGKSCSSATCTDNAFFNPNDYVAQVACETNNVNLLVAFCDNATSIVLKGSYTGGSSAVNSLSVPSSIPTSAPSTPVTPRTSLNPTPTPTTPPIDPSDPCQETSPTTPPTVPTKTGVSDPGGLSGSHPATTSPLAPTFTPSSVPSYTPSYTPSPVPKFTHSGDSCNSDSEPTGTPGSKHRRRRRRHRRAADQPHF